MAKQTGLGDLLLIDGVNFSGDIGSLGRIGGGNSPLDITGIDKFGFERIGGKRDGGIEFSAFFNDAAGAAHLNLRGLPLTDREATYFRGQTLGGSGASIIAKQINYDPTRADSGELTLAVQALANGFGLEWGDQLTAGLRTDTTATNGTGVDLIDVTTAFGWQAYLHVLSVVGTSVTVAIQDSADNAAFAALTGGTFAAVLAGTFGAQRLQGGSTATVRRFLRVVTTGTFSSAVFAVVFTRNRTDTTF